jgi:hypothetical protein
LTTADALRLLCSTFCPTREREAWRFTLTQQRTKPSAGFLPLEDADSDIPILKQAKAEYAKLQ